MTVAVLAKLLAQSTSLNPTTLQPINGTYSKAQFPVRGSAFVIAPEDRAAFNDFWLHRNQYASLAGNFMTDEFNLDWNKRRVFAWDGNKYITYGSGGQAVEDTAGKLPRTVKGPLVAGDPVGQVQPGGEAGVAKALDILVKEIDLTMTLLGRTTVGELGRHCLATRGD